MKQTIFYNRHIAMGARMVEFAGYMMPVEYTGINNEHNTVRNTAGLFDVSHMGTIWVKGEKALDFLQWVTSNDVSKLVPGKVQYSCLPNYTGGIIDDLLVYMYSKNKYFLVVNASNKDKDWAWLNAQNTFDVELENSSNNISQLALQGPMAANILQKITKLNVKDMKQFTFLTGNVASANNVIVSTTGYTGASGFEIYMHNTDAITIFDAIIEAGVEFNLKPAGLGCRDTLRLEKGYCLYGNDIDDTTSPMEAGLQWVTKFTPNKNFINKEFLQLQHTNGVERKLVGFEMIDKAIPRYGYEITNNEGIKIGNVTSGTMSPTLKIGIGMGYVATNYSEIGSNIFITIRGKNVKAKVVNLPFM